MSSSEIASSANAGWFPRRPDVRRFTLITLIVLLVLIGVMTLVRFGGRAKPTPTRPGSSTPTATATQTMG
jgi:hypothetical protein